MNIKGKIVQIAEEQSGESAKGPWRKQEYILQTDGEYPKKVCFMLWNDKIDEFAIKENENLDVSIDLESREYNARWYTDVRAWKVVRDDDGMTPHNQAKGDGYQPQQDTLENFNDEF
tara:strand:+ start:562 stop:912 length:351 start_codon:yes stop_codon:yes gene_type:complete